MGDHWSTQQGPDTAVIEGHSDPLFKTEDAGLTAQWDAIQRYQVELAVRQELAAYYTSSEWAGARTVLDLGTGNGYYLHTIASYFPGKAYLGIDKSPELIERARRSGAVEGVSFSQADFAETSGSYDFVIMRLLLQHLPDCAAVLNDVARLTKPGGAALIIDAYDAARFFEPEVPEFMRFFRAYAAQQAGFGLDRDVTEQIPDLIKAGGRWRVASQLQFTVPSTLRGNLGRIRLIYGHFIDIVERARTLAYDFARVRAEWRWWCGLSRAYAQVGMNIVQLERL